jgi:hypothetical protein
MPVQFIHEALIVRFRTDFGIQRVMIDNIVAVRAARPGGM